jgi:hypothetical protein
LQDVLKENPICVPEENSSCEARDTVKWKATLCGPIVAVKSKENKRFREKFMFLDGGRKCDRKEVREKGGQKPHTYT